MSGFSEPTDYRSAIARGLLLVECGQKPQRFRPQQRA